MKVLFYRDEIGEHRWTALSRNGNKLADSGEGYKQKQGAKKGFHAFQKACAEGNLQFEELI